ncbi:hypothetical protein C5167_008673 [Papaver somniferum]|uniref:Uncharacterized protein n=1 Tax=Papaver somniferum TaxID=3469 RepID=A0A4Y7JYB9_PAPSO|nr:hypothetical protein C5167_008673 [Papaver somniferum]
MAHLILASPRIIRIGVYALQGSVHNPPYQLRFVLKGRILALDVMKMRGKAQLGNYTPNRVHEDLALPGPSPTCSLSLTVMIC